METWAGCDASYNSPTHKISTFCIYLSPTSSSSNSILSVHSHATSLQLLRNGTKKSPISDSSEPSSWSFRIPEISHITNLSCVVLWIDCMLSTRSASKPPPIHYPLSTLTAQCPFHQDRGLTSFYSPKMYKDMKLLAGAVVIGTYTSWSPHSIPGGGIYKSFFIFRVITYFAWICNVNALVKYIFQHQCWYFGCHN